MLHPEIQFELPLPEIQFEPPLPEIQFEPSLPKCTKLNFHTYTYMHVCYDGMIDMIHYWKRRLPCLKPDIISTN